MYLSNISHIRPRFETSQDSTLKWLHAAHCKSESHFLERDDLQMFDQKMQETISKVAVSPMHIASRGHVLEDYLHDDFSMMQVYTLETHPEGQSLNKRSQIFAKEANFVFEMFYPEGAKSPDDLIHVSCTGYVSPSGAQKLCSKRNWHEQTTVTHAYHMGCYGSIPALRMAVGFIAAEESKERADIVHTEMCSLHLNPKNHKSDQIVCQSLFADGFIKYSITKQPPKEHSFKILAILEQMIPNSSESMTWDVLDFGFAMTLSKDVPVKIARYLESYLTQLAKKAQLDLKELLNNGIFAVHPGGPKIIQYVQELLKLENHQVSYSWEVLKNFGNMSSATLPHIWEKILKDPKIKNHTPIVSLAFGPGLTICGNIMVKQCG